VLSTATFDNVSLAPSLPLGWTNAGIGSPSPVGSASFAGSVYTVSGSGADIWNATDQFQYVSQPANGDQTMVARVTSLGDSNSR